MVDHENCVTIGSETIYTEESHVGYRQMLQNTQEMEPRWKASEVRLVFGDKMITKNLLLNSGMDKAILRCNLWHLLNEVYPRKNFWFTVFRYS